MAAFGVVSRGADSRRVATCTSGVVGAGMSVGGHSEGVVGEGGRDPDSDGARERLPIGSCRPLPLLALAEEQVRAETDLSAASWALDLRSATLMWSECLNAASSASASALKHA